MKKTNQKEVGLIAWNNRISTRRQTLGEPVKELNFSVTELGITNLTDIPDDLNIRFVIYNDTSENAHECFCCKETRIDRYVDERTFKMLSIWSDGGSYEIKFKTPEEEELRNSIIRVMQKEHFHGQFVCSMSACEVEKDFKFFKRQGEVAYALNDVQEMHHEQEKNEARF